MAGYDWWLEEAEDAYNDGEEGIGGAAALIAIAKILLPLVESIVTETLDEEDQDDDEVWLTHASD
jgi:hypothetical protein